MSFRFNVRKVRAPQRLDRLRLLVRSRHPPLYDDSKALQASGDCRIPSLTHCHGRDVVMFCVHRRHRSERSEQSAGAAARSTRKDYRITGLPGPGLLRGPPLFENQEPARSCSARRRRCEGQAEEPAQALLEEASQLGQSTDTLSP